MLAAAIGVERIVERQVGRVLPLQHALRAFHRHRGLERRQLLVCRAPAVVKTLAGGALEAPLDLQRGAAALHYFLLHSLNPETLRIL